jgi:hypothetical protein
MRGILAVLDFEFLYGGSPDGGVAHGMEGVGAGGERQENQD